MKKIFCYVMLIAGFACIAPVFADSVLQAEAQRLKEEAEELETLRRNVQTAHDIVWIRKNEKHQNMTQRLIDLFFKKLEKYEENVEMKEKLKQLQQLQNEMQKQYESQAEPTVYTAT